MPTDFKTEWATAYNTANVAFAKDWNAGYRGDRSAGRSLKELLAPALDAGKFAQALEALDKIDLAANTDQLKAALPAKVKSYKTAHETAKKAQTAYDKALGGVIDLKPTLKDANGYNVPTPIKTAYPATYRQLKVLQTEAKALIERAGSALHGAANVKVTDKIDATKEARVAKVTTFDAAANAALKTIKDDAAMELFTLKFVPAFKSSMAKGAAVIQKIKATPDLATYNTEMNNGGRDISQNLANLVKLKADATRQKSRLAKAVADPAPFIREITEFGNGAKRQLSNTAPPADVKTALAEFTDLYKRIAVAYANVLAGKVK